jgi:hypothetical protein
MGTKGNYGSLLTLRFFFPLREEETTGVLPLKGRRDDRGSSLKGKKR